MKEMITGISPVSEQRDASPLLASQSIWGDDEETSIEGEELPHFLSRMNLEGGVLVQSGEAVVARDMSPLIANPEELLLIVPVNGGNPETVPSIN